MTEEDTFLGQLENTVSKEGGGRTRLMHAEFDQRMGHRVERHRKGLSDVEGLGR